MKTLEILGIGGNCFHITRVAYGTCTENVMYRGEGHALSFRIRNKAGVPTLPLLFKTVLEVPARAVQQEKEKTSKLDRKEIRDFIRGVPYRVHTPKLKD